MDKLLKLFVDQLADVYDAEQRLARVLPRLARHATDASLLAALHRHLGETESQIRRLSTVFELSGKPAVGRKCHAVIGLIEDAHDVVADNKSFASINAALACSWQKIEHYEIASYSCLAGWACQLGLSDAANLLRLTWSEELETSRVLDELLANDFIPSQEPAENMAVV